MSLPKAFTMKGPHGKTVEVPSVGFGTWGAGDYGWCKEATIAALKAGYRHLDCAWKYGVDHEVGAAIRESGVPRSEIFITTKFWPNFSRPEHVEVCLDKCLEGMGLDYVDLFLAHFPVAFKPTSEEGVKKAWAGATASDEDQAIATNENGDPIVDLEYSAFDFAEAKGVKGSFVPTWKAMQKLVSAGKTRAVGVSNFSIRQVNELLPHSADIAVSCNQIEAHPWLPNNDVIAFNKKHGIVTTCFSPFAGQKADGNTLLKDQSVIELAKKNDMGIGQLLQSWAVQRGTIPLGKSQSPDRMKSNQAVRKLSDEDMEKLNSMDLPNGEGRTIDYSEKWGVKLYVN